MPFSHEVEITSTIVDAFQAKWRENAHPDSPESAPKVGDRILAMCHEDEEVEEQYGQFLEQHPGTQQAGFPWKPKQVVMYRRDYLAHAFDVLDIIEADPDAMRALRRTMWHDHFLREVSAAQNGDSFGVSDMLICTFVLDVIAEKKCSNPGNNTCSRGPGASFSDLCAACTAREVLDVESEGRLQDWFLDYLNRDPAVPDEQSDN